MKFRVVRASNANMICTYQADADPLMGCFARVLVDLLTQPEKILYPCVLRADSMKRLHIYQVPQEVTLQDLQGLPGDEDDVCGVVESPEELRRYILARLA